MSEFKDSAEVANASANLVMQLAEVVVWMVCNPGDCTPGSLAKSIQALELLREVIDENTSEWLGEWLDETGGDA